MIEFPEFSELVGRCVSAQIATVDSSNHVWTHKNASASLVPVPAGPHGDVAVLRFVDGRRSQTFLIVERSEAGARDAALRIVEHLNAWGGATM